MHYATREEILEADARLPEPTPEEQAEHRARARRLWDRMMAGLEAEERRWERIFAGWEAEARQPAEPNLGWAVCALLDRGSGLYTSESRNTAARWVADALKGLPGDARACAEVRRNLRTLAQRERRPMAELRREAMFAAVPEAAAHVGQLSHRQVRGNGPLLLPFLANGLLAAVRRILAEELRGEPVAEPHAVEALPSLGLSSPVLAEIHMLTRHLPPEQAAFLGALIGADGVIAQAARERGIARSTGSGHLRRIRQKIRATR